MSTRCLCGHGQSNHTVGAGQCWSAVCGCSKFREDDRRGDELGIPARFDERYDPSPEPIDRSIQ